MVPLRLLLSSLYILYCGSKAGPSAHILRSYSVQCWPLPPRFHHNISNKTRCQGPITRCGCLPGTKPAVARPRGVRSGCHRANAGTTKEICVVVCGLGLKKLGVQQEGLMQLWRPNVSPARKIFSTWCRRLHNHPTCSHPHRRPVYLLVAAFPVPQSFVPRPLQYHHSPGSPEHPPEFLKD